MSSAPACNQHFNSRRSANGCRLMNFFRFHKVGLRRSSWHLVPTAIHHNQCEYIKWFMKHNINRQSWLFFIFAITSVILSTKLHECVSATPLSSLAVWIHLFEVPRQSTAVLAGYCKPAGRCCRTWGRRRLSLSPGSPTYLKRAGTQTRQTSGRRSLHAPPPRLTNALRSVPAAVAEHHLTATCWNKKNSPSQLGELSYAVLLLLYISALWHKNITSARIFHDGNAAFPNLLLPSHWWNLTHQIIWN